MVRAGGVAADSNGTEKLALRVVERQTPAKYVHTADATAKHRIVRLPIVIRIASVSDERVYGVTSLQPEQAASRLHSAVKIRCGQRELRQTERICGIRFLGRDNPAARPLGAAIRAGEGNSTHHAVAIHDGAPHIQVESTVRLCPRARQCRLQLSMRRQSSARG